MKIDEGRCSGDSDHLILRCVPAEFGFVNGSELDLTRTLRDRELWVKLHVTNS